MLLHDDQRCIGGCGINEDVDQLFAIYDRFGRIWSYVSNRLGGFTVNHNDTLEHLEHFLYLGGFFKQARLSLKIIWLSYVGLFEKKETYAYFNTWPAENMHILYEQIKIQSYW